MGDLNYSLPTGSVAQEKVASAAAASVGSWGLGLWKWKSFKGGSREGRGNHNLFL